MINRFKPDYFRMVPDESGEFVYFGHHMDALKSAMEAKPSPATPNVTAALVAALRAIVDYYGYIGYFLTDKHIEDANNALHMAQLPVIPVSEDVETIREAITRECCHEITASSLAALGRLAAAAGRKD